MKYICVFCGSSSNVNDIYKNEAKKLGQELVERNLTLVYGGGNVGLMGILADEVLANNGKVIGVIPGFLRKKEVGHNSLTKLHVVDTMHERKQLMAELSDAFIAMPGGLGTLEELAEISTWVQLELMKKPIGVLNVNGFYDHLISQLNHMTAEGFLKFENLKNIICVNQAKSLLEELIDFKFGSYSIRESIDKT